MRDGTPRCAATCVTRRTRTARQGVAFDPFEHLDDLEQQSAGCRIGFDKLETQPVAQPERLAGAFDVIVEPRLTDPKAWYLMADPYAVDSLYYAYLEGNEGLRVDSTEEFKTDSMDYAVRGDFGAAAIDYRGIVKAAGK